MDDKKYFPLRVLHIVLLGVALVLCVIAFFSWVTTAYVNNSFSNGATVTSLIQGVVEVIALGAAILYSVSGFKKSAAGSYKVFASLLVLTLVLRVVGFFFEDKISLIAIIAYAASAMGTAVLAFGKDLGKRNALTIFAIIAALMVIMMATVIMRAASGAYGDLALNRLSGALANLLLVGTFGNMIYGKYIDKASRGSK